MLNPIQRYFPKLHRLFSTAAENSEAESLESPSLGQAGQIHPISQASSSLGKKAEGLPLSLLTLEVSELLAEGQALSRQGQSQEAIAYYRRAVHLKPTLGQAHQLLAEALSQQGDFAESALYYRQAIELSIAENSSFVAEVQSAVDVQSEEVQRTESPSAVLPKAQKSPKVEKIAEKRLPEDDLPWSEQAAFYLQQGEVLCHQQNWIAAATASAQAIALLEPDLAAAYIAAGWAWQEQGEFVTAEQMYGKAIAIQPISAVAHARLASIYAQQQRFSLAATFYEKAIALDPTFAGAYWKLAQVWQQMGEAENAAVCSYQALLLQPSWATADEYVSLGERLCRQGKLDWAVACYRQAVALEAGAAAYYGLGEALGQQGNWTAAVEAHRQGTLKDPLNPQFHAGLGQAFMALGHYPEAVQCYQQVIQLAPDQILGHEGLRDAWIKLDREIEALPCYQTLAALQPDSSRAQHEWGDALNRLNRWSEAVLAFRRAIALNPEFSWSHNNLGDALMHLGEWAEAAIAFRQAIVLHPSFHWSHYNLGEALAQQRQWDGAIEAYRCALELDPNLAEAQQKLSDTLRLRAKQDLSEALKFYHQAIAENPDEVQNYHKALDIQPDADLYVGLADALLRQKRIDGAIVFYQTALQLQPDHPMAAVQLKEALKRSHRKGFRTYRVGISSPDHLYAYWLEHNAPSQDDLANFVKAVSAFTYRPLISIVMPTYNTPATFLQEAIESVLSQVYSHWELCIADDASRLPHVAALLQQYAAQDSRIKVISRTQNGHISAASNSALTLASGEFIALLDHDDVLTPDALYEMVSLLNQHPEADMIYSDEDKLNEQGERIYPYFKPDWCPDSFLARMYTCHFGLYRRALIDRIGGFRLGYEGSQDYDLVLRFTEQTDNIFHIPKILYHWRMHAESAAGGVEAKPYAYEAAKRALADALERRNEPGKVVGNTRFPGAYTVRYHIADRLTDYPKVSIIIPSRNLGSVLDRCLQSIFSQSTYPNYEVIVIDNGSNESKALETIATWQRHQPQRFKSYKFNVPFNFSRINNFAAKKARGSYLLFLNNDTEVIAPDWIEAMVEQAQRQSIGAVGGLLLYPDSTVQHAGVLLGIQGIANHGHRYFEAHTPGYFTQIATVNNYSAITAACLMCRREVFEQVGGFDEQLAVAYNDVDLCLKMLQVGYRNVYLPHVQLYHHESRSRGYEKTSEKMQRLKQESELMRKRWGKKLESDPCYNPNLTKETEDYELNIPGCLSIGITQVTKSHADSEWLAGWSIDTPVQGKNYKIGLPIRGWVIGQYSDAIAIEVVHNNQIIYKLAIDVYRPDVKEIYAHHAKSGRSGFSGIINCADVDVPNEVVLQVVLADQKRVYLGTIHSQMLT
ncbi:MAG TPA: tetratricopeptide repeat protein [Coleofasciculaceae cyanobacterium]|jgi:tetratricopeptide (TPR) repeat protein